ncbi:YybH family protein [Kitasatospora sp. LaBMicrA B282]|uniref:YybH family protein n=1 Tax=Kitasatospora sp. LaBMicrA B282 TaxID=3420949 RepID=UPI003D1363BB
MTATDLAPQPVAEHPLPTDLAPLPAEVHQLPTEPHQLPLAFAAAFNSGDLAAVDRLFEPGAVFVTSPGVAVTGDQRRAANAEFLALGLPIELTLRHVYVHEDIALLIGDYLIEGTAPDGTPVRDQGSATDVARRGADGCWRYAIDNPAGVTRAALA